MILLNSVAGKPAVRHPLFAAQWRTMDTPPQTLSEIEAAIWQELGRASAQRGHPWRVATLATVTADGEADGRSVVIRQVDAAERELVFFTDARSPKVRQIGQRSGGVLVMWSAELGWQLRIQAVLEVETAGLAVSSHWARLKMRPGRFDYLSPLPPGTPLERPTPARGERAHFAVVTARVQRIDWLDLGTDGQRRASFGAPGDAGWLQP